MKTTFRWLSLTVFLLSGVGIVYADGPPAAPPWLGDWYLAYGEYNRGVAQIQTDPKAAVDTLLKADKFLKLAFAEGASTQALQLNDLVRKALAIAENAKSTAEPVVDKPAGEPVSDYPTEEPVVNKSAIKNNAVHAKQLHAK